MNYYFHYRIAQRIRIARRTRLLMSSHELSPITPRKVDRGKSISISVASSQKSKDFLLSDAEILSRNENLEAPNRSNDLSDSDCTSKRQPFVENHVAFNEHLKDKNDRNMSLIPPRSRRESRANSR